MSDDLGSLVVSFAAELSGLTTGANEAIGQISSVENAAQSMSSYLANLPPLNLGNAITEVDVAQAKLTLIENKVQEARDKLATLQGAANAGEAVTGIPEAQAQLLLLENDAEQARQALQDVQSAPEEGSGGFLSGIGNMVNGVMGFGQQIGLAIFGFQNMINIAGNLGQALFGPAAQAEQLQTAFTTLDGSTQKATAELQKLNTFAAKTPFQTQDIDHAASTLQAFGVNAQDVIPDLTGMGDALSAMGKTSGPDLDQLTLAFGHIQSDGKLTGRTMMELGQLGINGMQMLQDATGLSKDKLQQMISNGTLPANQAIKDLVNGIEKSNLGGGMAKQAQTFNGQLSTMQSNIHLALAGFGGPILKEAEQGLSKLGELVSSPGFQQFAITVGQGIATGLDDIVKVIGGVVTGFQNLANFFQQNQVAADVLVGILYGLLFVVGALNADAIIAAITSIPAMVVAFGAWTVSAGAAAVATLAATWPILLIGAIIAAVVVGIILAVQHWGQIWTWLKSVWGDAVGFFEGIGHGIGNAFSAIGTFFHNIWNGIVGDFKGGVNFIIGLVDQMISMLNGFHISVPSISIGPVSTPAFNFGLSIPLIPYLAKGGTISSGGLAMVGEQGPEYVYLPTGASVYPHGTAPAMQQPEIHNHFHVYLNGQEMTNIIMQQAVSQLLNHGPVKAVL